MIIFIAGATFVSTLLGGLFALRLKDKLHLILGFSAGAIIGVAFFDIIPEALELGGVQYDSATITALVAVGFLIYLVLDRLVLLHGHTEEDTHEHQHRGTAGAGSLSFHSFLDGIAIGLAFHISSALGITVAAAVLAHDFSDGINTVNLVLKHGGDKSKALRWLMIDAFAPVIGIAVASFFAIPDAQLGLLLALFAGFFLYIGASDLIPESHHAHPVWWTTVATVLGAAVLYVVINLAGV
ncbi:ZIP family metal transporter [Candidatus Kaiserbacteria bacterium]|nr:ZIP family metal transporter [Candidatus Kaiserbacteria bacterium]